VSKTIEIVDDRASSRIGMAILITQQQIANGGAAPNRVTVGAFDYGNLKKDFLRPSPSMVVLDTPIKCDASLEPSHISFIFDKALEDA
jgi:hypothetical protein